MLITNMLTAAKLQRIVSKRVFFDSFFAARKNAVIPKSPISKPAPAFRKSTVLKSNPFCKYCHPIARQKNAQCSQGIQEKPSRVLERNLPRFLRLWYCNKRWGVWIHVFDSDCTNDRDQLTRASNNDTKFPGRPWA